MAPEQIYQKQFGLDGRISSRTDLWAVGVIIYKVFTGKIPFGNDVQDIELVHEAITKEEFDLTGVPKEYHKLLKKCFQKNAEDRVSNANLMFKLIDEEETVVESKENDNYLGKTIPRLGKKDVEEHTMPFLDVGGNNNSANEENSFASPTKTEKIVLAIFGIVNILWFGYYWFSEENTPYVYLLYPITIILFCFFYLKPINKFIIPKFLVYGLIMYFNTLFLVFLFTTIFENTFEGKSILTVGFAFIFQIGLSIWLLFKHIKKVWEGSVNTVGLTSYLLGTFFLVYLISYFLDIDNGHTGVSTVFLISDELGILTLLPNVFFTTALVFFAFKEHKKNLWYLLALFIVSVGIASIWWLVLDYGNGYKISMISSYMQELKAGYYLWFITILLSFTVILYDAFITYKLKKIYWPILGVLILVLGISFYTKWSNSEDVYNFNRGAENVDYNQFKKAFDYGKPLSVSSYEIKNFVKKILTKYTNENAGTVKSMLQLFVNSNGVVTYIEDAELASAITKKDPELLKILLNPTGSTKFNDVDFVNEDKSLLQLARDLENPEMEKLLVDAGAKLTDQEQVVVDLKEMKTKAKTKIYTWEENFSNSSTIFEQTNNQDGRWSLNPYNKSFMLTVQNEKKPYSRVLDFSKNLDETKPYSVSVKVQRKKRDPDVGVGVVFDSNGKDYHISVIKGNTIFIYKFFNNKWIEIYKKPVVISSVINTITVYKVGNYVSCSVNGNRIIQNIKIESVNGLSLGIICSNPIRKTVVFFDDFKVTGTKK